MFLINPYILQASGNPLWDGLQAYYTADNTPNDALGNYNLTAINGANYGTGIINQGFNFDGVNDYYDAGNVLDFDGSTSFSFSFWVNPTTVGNKNLIQKWTGLNEGYIIFLFGSKLRFGLSNNISTNVLRVETTTSITTSMTHITITYDGSKDVSGVKIYINGISDTLTTLNNTLTGSASTTANLEFGRIASAVGWYDGILDEVGVWDKELTASEVTDLYNSGAGLQY